MRTAWETFPIEFTGGLMTSVNPLQQGINFPGSASKLINFEPSVEGGYKKILGFNKWTTEVVPGTGLVQGVILVSPDDCIAVRAGKYYLSEGKAAWVEKYDSTISTPNKVRHATFNFDGTEKIVMVNGLTKPIYYESATNTIVQDSAAPADVLGASIVVEHKNRLFFAKDSFLTFTVQYDELDYTPGNGAGVINIGSDITGMITFRDQLIIFCQDQIKRLVGSSLSDFELLDITERTGALSHDTIQEVGGDVLYLGPDGIRYLSATEKVEDFSLQRASEAIQKDVTELFENTVNYSSLVIRRKAQYRIFKYEEETSAENTKGLLGTRFLDQQPSGISWGEVNGIKCFVSSSKQFGSNEVIIFANETDYVYQLEVGYSFDGVNIPCVFITPSMPINDPQVRKTFYKHSIYLKAMGALNLNARLILDYSQNPIQPDAFLITQDLSSVSVYDESLYDSGIYSSVLKTLFKSQVVGSGFTVALAYSESSTSPSFSLDTAILEYQQNDRK